MIRLRRPMWRGPRHAGPSALVPSRTLVLGVSGGVLALGVIAGCAAVASAQGDSAHPAAALRSAPDRAGTPGNVAAADASLPPAAFVPPTWGAAGPPLSTTVPVKPGQRPTGAVVDTTSVSGLAASGIPSTALAAYRAAAAREARLDPSCGLTWPLLAGIGRVESDHGRFAGAVLHTDGLSTPPVIGIRLDGTRSAVIRDTDGGRLDGDTLYDRAVGPMQFIPSTWATWGVDANGDGKADPFNIKDAAAAAAAYLCASGRNLTTTAGQVQAILTYNHTMPYVKLVMALENVYAHDVGLTVPVLPTTPDPHPDSAASSHGRSSPTTRAARPSHPASTSAASSTHAGPPTHPTSSSTRTKPSSPSTSAPSCPTATPSSVPSSASSSSGTATPSVPPGCPTPTPSDSASGSSGAASSGSSADGSSPEANAAAASSDG